MFFTLCDALFRSVVLLGLALAPFAAPLEVRRSQSVGEALVRLAIAAAVNALVVAAIRWAAPRQPSAALGAVVTWLGITICAATVSPILAALPVAAVLVWGTIAVFSYGFVSRSAPKLGPAAAGVALLLGAVSYGGGHARVGTPEARVRAGLMADPGNEAAAVARAAALRAEHRSIEAGAVLRECATMRPTACACATGAALAALDAAAHKEALARLDAAACGDAEPLGMRAEALAGLGLAADAIATADRALIRDPDDGYALYAKARGLQQLGNTELARRYVSLAVARGRGVGPRTLLGLLLFQAGDLDAAATEFRAVLELEPDNLPAAYDLALIAHKQDRYREAREGYLRVLKLDPAYADARVNLALLTHAAGASGEAVHHLEELRRIAPGDPRIEGLARTLASPNVGNER